MAYLVSGLDPLRSLKVPRMLGHFHSGKSNVRISDVKAQYWLTSIHKRRCSQLLGLVTRIGGRK